MLLNILLFLLASLFCIFFLSALSSILVQSSLSLLLYFSLICKSVISFAPLFADTAVIVAVVIERRKWQEGKPQELSEMSEISANPRQDP